MRDNASRAASPPQGGIRPRMCKAGSILPFVMAVVFAVGHLGLVPKMAYAEALEGEGFIAVGAEGFVSWMDGRMGFERDVGLVGTLNDFRDDLGLSTRNQTLRLEASARPLEHHVLRIYGSLPERYTGETILKRQLVTRTQTIPAGTLVSSQLRTAQVGMGYDLDFLLSRRFQAGLNGDMKFLSFYVRFNAPESGAENTLAVDEFIPCIGGHAQTFVRPSLMLWPRSLSLGGYGRLTYGINPNYLNYFDVKLGVTGACIALDTVINVKVGYQLEGWSQLNVAGRDLEFKREGIFVGLAAAY